MSEAHYTAPDPDHSYIYVIACGEYRKIGRAANPKGRLAAIQTGNPELCELEYCRLLLNHIVGPAESAAHRILQRRRVRGEWFLCSKDDALAAVRMGCREVIDDHAIRTGLLQKLMAESAA